MRLMKKDMGGAAIALSSGYLIMAQNLPIRLRVLISAAEKTPFPVTRFDPVTFYILTRD